jgi:uncharacterized protein
MVVGRVLLLAALLSNSAVFSMKNLEIMRMRKASINTLLEAVVNTLLGAVATNDIEAVQLYLNNGGSINVQGTMPASPYLKEMRGMTPLMVSAFYGCPRLMKILIQNGALLNRTNEFGETALMIAARLQYASLVRLLVNAGANKDMRNNNGKTAFDEASNSLLRPLYSDYSKRRGRNRSFAEITRFLENSETKFLKNREDDTTSSVQAQINRKVVKVDNIRTSAPSLQYFDNAIGYYEPMMNSEYYPKKLMHNIRATMPHIIIPNHYVILPNHFKLLEWSK